MAQEPATNPVEGEDTAATTLPENPEVENEGQIETETLYDDDGNPIEAEPPEDEEVELDADLKLKVPKDQAQKVREALLRQADYTRKTQELAEQRRAFEADRQNIQQATQEELGAFAQAAALGQQIAQYQKIDWAAWNDNDPFEAQKAFMQFQQVKDAHQEAMNQLSHYQRQRVSRAQQESAQRIEQGRQQLEREIGWNDELKARLTDYALGMGLSREDLSDLEATPAAAKILRDAYEGHQARQKAQAAERHKTAQQVQPAATVRAKAAPVAGLDDRLGAEEWIRRRDAQVRKRA